MLVNFNLVDFRVSLTQQAREVSAFTMPDGLYEYTVMSFGMKNPSVTFQHMINQLIIGLMGCQAKSLYTVPIGRSMSGNSGIL